MDDLTLSAPRSNDVITAYLDHVAYCVPATTEAASICDVYDPAVAGFSASAASAMRLALALSYITAAAALLGLATAVYLALRERGALTKVVSRGPPLHIGAAGAFAWVCVALLSLAIAAWCGAALPSLKRDVLPRGLPDGSSYKPAVLSGLACSLTAALLSLGVGLWTAVLQCKGIGGPACCRGVARAEAAAPLLPTEGAAK